MRSSTRPEALFACACAALRRDASRSRSRTAARPPNGQPAVTSGHGLAGLSERVSLFGGNLSARASAGRRVRPRSDDPARETASDERRHRGRPGARPQRPARAPRGARRPRRWARPSTAGPPSKRPAPCARTYWSWTSACRSWTASRPRARSWQPASPPASSSSPPTTSTSTSTRRYAREPAASCSSRARPTGSSMRSTSSQAGRRSWRRASRSA